VDLEPLPFSFTDSLESVRDIVQPIAEEKASRSRLVSRRARVRVGHPVALSRVLLNLTTNALKFTDTDASKCGAIEGRGHAIEVSVRDTGRGIPPQSMALLFEPFRAASGTATTPFPAQGSAVHQPKLVEAMGAISTSSTDPGRAPGSCFTLALPRQTADLARRHPDHDHLLHVVGARPNFMKVAPVLAGRHPCAGCRQVLVHTGSTTTRP
jgi:signal transduction histidine kinase